jgi:hypothetical protein
MMTGTDLDFMATGAAELLAPLGKDPAERLARCRGACPSRSALKSKEDEENS